MGLEWVVLEGFGMKAPHEVTLRDIKAVNREHAISNARILSDGWVNYAFYKIADGNADEAGYSARCAYHFIKLAF